MCVGLCGWRAGPAIFVAIVSFSRSAGCFASHVPRYVSVRPCVCALGGTGYISAVSISVTPWSIA
ncbi:hypothetical protein DM56_4811 [Burkholderia mallei]|nr:hypothetical protein DM75_4225 [Burkholderia mallei]KOS95156.1 hypothetical protein DM45_4057 [Burkholderia mallei]KOS99211.1 hypothetical protein DM49_4176 [Burkholderia mallei]KOT02684.1 hypothetical protein DM50_4113 [Burkholderia mallei]KOT12017.1 hypothetical protein DM56_4811 [Burkholderia mallei]